MDNPFELLSTRQVYRNRWIQLREDQIRADGHDMTYGVLDMKHGSTVLAVNDAREAFLVKEFKYAVGRVSIEAISGGLEENETPLDGAKRELKEEAGLTAREWIDLGVLDPFTTVINCRNYLFLALGVEHGETSPDRGEILELVTLPFAKVLDMVVKSEITHGASSVAVLKADRYFRGL